MDYGERHVIIQQAQDPNTGEVLVFLQGEDGETVCLPPEALNANIVQMEDEGGQVYTLALPQDADGSSVVVVSEQDETEGAIATLVTDETATVIATTSSTPATVELGGTIETIDATTGTINIPLQSTSSSDEHLIVSVVEGVSNSDSSSTQVVQSYDAPLMVTSQDATASIEENNDANISNSNDQTESTENNQKDHGGSETITVGINSIVSDDKKSNEEENSLPTGESNSEETDGIQLDASDNMNFGSAVIQVQDANSTSLDSLVANAMVTACDSNYVIMTTDEDGGLPKEINLADVINAGSASGQTIFLQTSEGLVACQAATTGEDGSLQIVSDSSGNAGTVITTTTETSDNQAFQGLSGGQTLAYTLSSTSSGIELTPVTNVVSATTSPIENQLTTVSSRARAARHPKPRTIPITTPTAPATMGETLLLPSKSLVTSPSLAFQSSASSSRKRTITTRTRSNISVSITPSSSFSSSSSPIIPVQPDAIHSSSSDFTTLTKSSSEIDASILTEGVSGPSQLASSRRTYSKRNNIVWLNPETTNISNKRNAKSPELTQSSSGDVNASKESDDSKINLPAKPINDQSLTSTSTKFTVKPPTTLTVSSPVTVSNVSTLRSPKTVTEPTIETSSNSSSLSPSNSSKNIFTRSSLANKDSSKVNDKSDSSSTSSISGVPSMIKVQSLPQLGRIVTSPIKVTSPVKPSSPKPSSPFKVTSPTKVTSPVKVSSPSKNLESSETDLDFALAESAETGPIPSSASPIKSPERDSPTKVTSPVKNDSPTKNQEAIDIDLDGAITDLGDTDAALPPASPFKSPEHNVSTKADSPVKINSPTKNQESNDIGLESNPTEFEDAETIPTPSSPLKSPERNTQQSQDSTLNNQESDIESDLPKTRSLRKRKSPPIKPSSPVKVISPSKVTSPAKVTLPTKNQEPCGTGAAPISLDDTASIPTPASPVKSPERIVVKSPERIVVKSPERSAIKSPERSVLKSPERSVLKSPERSVLKSPERSAIKSPERSVVKSPERSVSFKITSPTKIGSPTKADSPVKDSETNDASSDSGNNDAIPPPLSPIKSPECSTRKPQDSLSTPKNETIIEKVQEPPKTRSLEKRKLPPVKPSSPVKAISSAKSTSPTKNQDSSNLVSELVISDSGDNEMIQPATSPIKSPERITSKSQDSSPLSTPLKESTSSNASETPKLRSLRKRKSGTIEPAINKPEKSAKISKIVSEPGTVVVHFGSDSDKNESEETKMISGLSESRGPSEFFDFTNNDCCFHIRHQSGRLVVSPHGSDGNYACQNKCGYRTSRINNLILHHKHQCTVMKMLWQNEINKQIQKTYVRTPASLMERIISKKDHLYDSDLSPTEDDHDELEVGVESEAETLPDPVQSQMFSALASKQASDSSIAIHSDAEDEQEIGMITNIF